MKLPRYMKLVTSPKPKKALIRIRITWWGWPIILLQMLKSKQVEIDCKWYQLPWVIIQLMRTWARIVREANHG